MFTWFCEWRAPDAGTVVTDADLRAMVSLIRDCRLIESAFLLRPATAVDPHYPSTETSPVLVAQINFDDVFALEATIARSGALAALIEPGLFPSLEGLQSTQEAMIRRRYRLVEYDQPGRRDEEITYLVTYTGPAEDDQAWHLAYLSRHRILLSKLAGLRCLEIFTPATIVSGLPMPFVCSLQRNKTVFSSSASMKEAMLSDVRKELRADFEAFPPFAGESRHEPFATIQAF